LEKKPSMRLTQGCERELEPARWLSGEPSVGFLGDVGGMIVEDQLDSGLRRICRIEKFEKFDELSAAVAVSDEGMNFTGQQINAGQQTERTMAFVLMITREGRMDSGLRRQIRRGRCDGLDSRLFVVGDDRDRPARFLGLGSLFQDPNLAINAQNFSHLLLELGVATFQIVPHLMRLNFFIAENLADRALGQIGKTFVPSPWRILACMAGQQPSRPQLVWIAVILGLVARQRHQPSLGLRRNHRLLARPWPVIQSGQRAIGKRSLDAAFDSLMMHANLSPNSKERRGLTVRATFAPAPPDAPLQFASAQLL